MAGKTATLLQVERRGKIALMEPVVDSEMAQAALSALQNERLVLGESVHKFEEEFARYCGSQFGVSTGSGTAALQIALQALGIDGGDEVLTTPFSFWATSNAVLHAGGVPKFADVEPSGFNLDPTSVSEYVTARTKAIIPVHLYGRPARMDEFLDLAEEHRLALVEDACQAHGAELNGKRVGALGHAGCFSFYTSKNMTVCGDGGMIVTDDPEVAEAAKSLRDCGRASKYSMSRIGYTSRMNTVNAAIGRVQLKRLNEWNMARRRIASEYRRGLEGVKGIVLPLGETGTERHVYHLFVIRSRFRNQIMKWLSENGVESGIHYPVPIHLQPPYRKLFGYAEGLYPESERLAGEVLSLPMHPNLSEDDVRYVSQLVREATEEFQRR